MGPPSENKTLILSILPPSELGACRGLVCLSRVLKQTTQAPPLHCRRLPINTGS